MSKELADRLEEVSEYLVLTRNIGMSNAAVLNEAIAALRSEPEYALIADDCGGPARKLYAAPSREPTHLYQCCDCGRKSWDESDELAHCNFPQPNGKRCAGQMLPIAPSRESRTDHQEPELSAEQVKRLAPSACEVEIGAILAIDAGYLDDLCDMALSSLRGTFADGVEAAAKLARKSAYRDVREFTEEIRALAQGEMT